MKTNKLIKAAAIEMITGSGLVEAIASSITDEKIESMKLSEGFSNMDMGEDPIAFMGMISAAAFIIIMIMNF